MATPTPEQARPGVAVVLTWLGGVAVGATLLAAVLVAVVYGLSWFSAARLAGFLTAFAFSVAFFSAASGRDSAAAGRTAAGASTASTETARRAYGQQLYELARATHADLTTGEVARARDVLGGVGRRRQGYWPPEGSGVDLAPLGESLRSPGYTDAHMQLEDARRAWFTLLWCF